MRHASADPVRTARVVRLVREKWDGLEAQERDWLGQHWPQAHPDGPSVDEVQSPDPAMLQDWIATDVLV